jgi:elongation factor P
MKASQMQKGQVITIDGKLYTILDFEHIHLGGRGGAVYQTKLKSLADGLIQNVRLRAEERVEEAEIEKRTYEYLYSTGREHVLMDMTTYEQVTLDSSVFGDGAKYLKPNTQLDVSIYEGKPIIVNLPDTVDLEVTQTQPEVKRATATSQNKPATLETGFIVQVPSFIKAGDIVRVDTRSGEYVTRVKD